MVNVTTYGLYLKVPVAAAINSFPERTRGCYGSFVQATRTKKPLPDGIRYRAQVEQFPEFVTKSLYVRILPGKGKVVE